MMWRGLLTAFGWMLTALPYWWIVDTWLKLNVSTVVDVVGMIVIAMSIPQYSRMIRHLEELCLRLFSSPREARSVVESISSVEGKER